MSEALSWATAVALVAILAQSARNWWQERDRSSLTLTVALGLIALVGLIGRASVVFGELAWAPEVITVIFAASGYALLEFRASVFPLARLPRALAALFLGGTATFLIALPTPDGAIGQYTPLQHLALTGFVFAWIACVIDPIVRFWVSARTRPPVEAARLRLLSAGFAGVVVVLVVSTLVEQAARPGVGLGMRAFGLLLMPILYIAVAPPRPVRLRWLQSSARRQAERVMAVGTWLWDLPTGVVAWSELLHEIYGTDPHTFEASYEAFVERVHPEDRDRVNETVQRHYADGTPFEFDHRLLRPDGTVRWLHARGEVVRDPAAGHVVGMLGTAQDITERKENELRLKRSEERFRSLVESAPDAVVVVDQRGTILLVNDQTEKLLAYDRAQLLGRPVEVLLPHGLEDAHTSHRQGYYGHARRRPMAAGKDMVIRGNHGLLIPVEISLAPVETDHQVVVVASIRDVREQKKAQAALRESEHMLKEAEQLAHVGSFRWDLTDGKVRWSDEMFRLYGLEPGRREPGIDDLVERIHPDDREPCKATVDAALEEGEPFQVDYRVEVAGADRWLSARGQPIPDADGNVVAVVGTVQDTTESKRAQRALQEAYEREREAAERLRHLDRMKNSFLEAVSHELRTPLTTVLGFSRTLARPEVGLNEAERQSAVERIVANAERLERLLADLLDLDRITRGVLEPQRRPVRLYDLVAAVLGDVDVQGHPIALDVEDAVVEVSPAQVERILENLVVNIARHTAPGTPIWLRAEATEDGCLLVVEDAGPGIPDELKKAVFEPFRRGEGSAARAGGTGIGLSLVARFAELHGGRAWVEDRKGGGSSFRVWLPAAPDMEISSSGSRAEAQTR